MMFARFLSNAFLLVGGAIVRFIRARPWKTGAAAAVGAIMFSAVLAPTVGGALTTDIAAVNANVFRGASHIDLGSHQLTVTPQDGGYFQTGMTGGGVLEFSVYPATGAQTEYEFRAGDEFVWEVSLPSALRWGNAVADVSTDAYSSSVAYSGQSATWKVTIKKDLTAAFPAPVQRLDVEAGPDLQSGATVAARLVTLPERLASTHPYDQSVVPIADTVTLGVYELHVAPNYGGQFEPSLGTEGKLTFATYPSGSNGEPLDVSVGDTISWRITLPAGMIVRTLPAAASGENYRWACTHRDTQTIACDLAITGDQPGFDLVPSQLAFDVAAGTGLIADAPARAQLITLPHRYQSQHPSDQAIIPVARVQPHISAGSTSSVALAADGRVFAWGENNAGQLGNGTVSSVPVPVPVPVDMSGALAGKRIIATASGVGHTVALADDGRVYAWGRNEAGQLGDGSTVSSAVPVAVDMSGVFEGRKVTAVAAGDSFSVAVADDGRVYAWGMNDAGQLGDGSTVSSAVPVAVDMSGALAGRWVTDVAVGDLRADLSGDALGHVVVVADDGRVYAWGMNSRGQLGDGSTVSSSVPVAVDTSGALGGKNVTAVVSGAEYTAALADDGRVYAWGTNARGQLGDGSTDPSSAVPVVVDMNGVLAGKRVIAVAAGWEYMLASADDGRVYGWGMNYWQQLGANSRDLESRVPIRVIQQGWTVEVPTIYVGGSFREPEEPLKTESESGPGVEDSTADRVEDGAPRDEVTSGSAEEVEDYASRENPEAAEEAAGG